MGMKMWAVRQASLVWSEWIIVMVEIRKMRGPIKVGAPRWISNPFMYFSLVSA